MKKQNRIRKVRHILAIIGISIGGILLAMIMALVFGVLVMLLWNWLMPAIFGLTTIGFWQAWGLVVLSHILFKSSPHHKPSHHDHDHWEKRFKKKFFSEDEINDRPIQNAEA